MTENTVQEHWQRLKQAFRRASEAGPQTRQQLLVDLRKEEPLLAGALEELIDQLPEVDGFLETGSHCSWPAQAPAASEVGQQVGPYLLEKELGSGGMGTVYLASRTDQTYLHKVAVKVLKKGMDTAEVVRLFMRERQILANLNHPNIARLFDGGSTPWGTPYFVMDYVEGLPITDYCRQARLDLSGKLTLMKKVCDAVQYAHQNLVVHRDLKPGNILVDAQGEPKLLDLRTAINHD